VLLSKKLRDFVVFVFGFAGVIIRPVDVLTSQLERSQQRWLGKGTGHCGYFEEFEDLN
jgi:hypothetical protein